MICDFGLSVLCNDIQGIESMKTANGTCGFVAPEFFDLITKTEDFDFLRKEPNSDVFAAGVIMYMLLTGHSPWKGYINDKALLKSNK